MNIYRRISFIELIVLFALTIATAVITYIAIGTGGYYEANWTFSSGLMSFSLNALDILFLYFALYLFIYLFYFIFFLLYLIFIFSLYFYSIYISTLS